MDLLITVIGNAVLDPVFRERLLKNPLQALDDWRFRLTNSEFTMLLEMFSKLSQKQKDDLESKFHSVGAMLYQNRDQATSRRVCRVCPPKRCLASVYPSLPSLRNNLKKRALAEWVKVA